MAYHKNIKIKDDANHPYLLAVQKALADNPKRTIKSFLGQGVGPVTLRAWAAQGWITFIHEKRTRAQPVAPYVSPYQNPRKGRMIRFASNWKPNTGQNMSPPFGMVSSLSDGDF